MILRNHWIPLVAVFVRSLANMETEKQLFSPGKFDQNLSDYKLKHNFLKSQKISLDDRFKNNSLFFDLQNNKGQIPSDPQKEKVNVTVELVPKFHLNETEKNEASLPHEPVMDKRSLFDKLDQNEVTSEQDKEKAKIGNDLEVKAILPANHKVTHDEVVMINDEGGVERTNNKSALEAFKDENMMTDNHDLGKVQPDDDIEQNKDNDDKKRLLEKHLLEVKNMMIDDDDLGKVQSDADIEQNKDNDDKKRLLDKHLLEVKNMIIDKDDLGEVQPDDDIEQNKDDNYKERLEKHSFGKQTSEAEYSEKKRRQLINNLVRNINMSEDLNPVDDFLRASAILASQSNESSAKEDDDILKPAGREIGFEGKREASENKKLKENPLPVEVSKTDSHKEEKSLNNDFYSLSKCPQGRYAIMMSLLEDPLSPYWKPRSNGTVELYLPASLRSDKQPPITEGAKLLKDIELNGQVVTRDQLLGQLMDLDPAIMDMELKPSRLSTKYKSNLKSLVTYLQSFKSFNNILPALVTLRSFINPEIFSDLVLALSYIREDISQDSSSGSCSQFEPSELESKVHRDETQPLTGNSKIISENNESIKNLIDYLKNFSERRSQSSSRNHDQEKNNPDFKKDASEPFSSQGLDVTQTQKGQTDIGPDTNDIKDNAGSDSQNLEPGNEAQFNEPEFERQSFESDLNSTNSNPRKQSRKATNNESLGDGSSKNNMSDKNIVEDFPQNDFDRFFSKLSKASSRVDIFGEGHSEELHKERSGEESFVENNREEDEAALSNVSSSSSLLKNLQVSNENYQDFSSIQQPGPSGNGSFDQSRNKLGIVWNHDIFKTYPDTEPESRLNYLREDLQLNAVHQYWHIVVSNNRVQMWRQHHARHIDRRGELFYYMHRQVLARYNSHRLSVGLPLVVGFGREEWGLPLLPGYDSKLDTIIGVIENTTHPEDSFVVRAFNLLHAAGGTLPDFIMKNPGHFPIRPAGAAIEERDVATLEYEEDKILEAIHNGFITNLGVSHRLGYHNGVDHGISHLGDVVEALEETEEYGDFHNDGHYFIGALHGNTTMLGIMSDPMTSMRDPMFYRWHKHCDDIMKVYKNSLPAYTDEELDFPGVELTSISVKSDIEWGPPENLLETYFEIITTEVTQFGDRPIPVEYTRLNNSPFNYNIILTSSVVTIGMVRIFLMPEDVSLTGHTDLTQVIFELDKFPVVLKKGKNKIVRRSRDSHLTLKNTEPLAKLRSKLIKGDMSLLEFARTKCGLPQEMLLPRGTEEGMRFKLFAMVSQFLEDDSAWFTDWNHMKSTGWGWCGVTSTEDFYYPDSRPMGFPLDRAPKGNHVEELMTKSDSSRRQNMALINVTVRFDPEALFGSRM